MLRKTSILWAMAGALALSAVLPAGAETIHRERVGTLAMSDRAAADATAPDAELLRAYQPVLVLHPAESFQPTKIQSFVADSELEQFTGTSRSQLPLDRYWTVVNPDPGPGELPPSTPGVFYRLNQVGCSAADTLAGKACYADAWSSGSGGDAVYGRVARTENRIVLQYWLFYYDNPLLLPPTPVGTFWQSHEGDWEVVNVVLDQNEQPREAAYSQHCSGERVPWPEVEKSPAGSTHPVVYVALGSHANYFAPGAGALGLIPIPASCIPAAVRSVLPRCHSCMSTTRYSVARPAAPSSDFRAAVPRRRPSTRSTEPPGRRSSSSGASRSTSSRRYRSDRSPRARSRSASDPPALRTSRSGIRKSSSRGRPPHDNSSAREEMNGVNRSQTRGTWRQRNVCAAGRLRLDWVTRRQPNRHGRREPMYRLTTRPRRASSKARRELTTA